MMKKTIKKLLAALLAVAMVCAMAIPAFAYDTKEDLNKKHGYIAFQIFKGVISKDNQTLSDVYWGKNIPHPEDFLPKLKEDPTLKIPFQDADNLQDVLAVISTWHNSDDDSIAFARFVCNYIYTDPLADSESTIVGGNGAIKIPEPGYYLIVDNTYFNLSDFYHAYNSFFLVNDTHQGEYNVTINHKVVKPTVEKKVYDNDNNDISSAGGWGSSADHAINEEFKFQLTATLPASENNGRAYDYYNEYAVLFNDTLSKGITYDRIDKVAIECNNKTYDITNDFSKYFVDMNDLESHNYFVVGIPDVKTCVPDLNKGATITVTYTAHLNENAAVNGSTDNKNKVQLQYSNNPSNSAYWGFTPESAVCVYTYQLNNTKYHDSIDANNKLPGAGFRLYSDKDCKNEVELYQEGNLYYPIKDAKKVLKTLLR